MRTRTRRHRNKTKNNRKRGGADLFRRASAFTRKYFSCCRPGQQPDDPDGVAAAAAAGVGPALPPPGSPPFIRRARGSLGSPVSPDASCVPCPRGSSRPPSRPLPEIPPSPSFRLATPDRLRRGQAALDEARGRASSLPQPPVSGTPTRSLAQPMPDNIINECIRFWTSSLESKRARMRDHLDQIDRVTNLRQLSMRNRHHHSIISSLRDLVDSTAREIMTAIVSIEYWTHVLNGRTQRPLLYINPESMVHTQWTRILKFRSAPYTQRLRDILRDLPRLTSLNINTFRYM